MTNILTVRTIATTTMIVTSSLPDFTDRNEGKPI
jgi:hypothetical protein